MRSSTERERGSVSGRVICCLSSEIVRIVIRGDPDLDNDVFCSGLEPTAFRGPPPELFMDDAERCNLLNEALDW